MSYNWNTKDEYVKATPGTYAGVISGFRSVDKDGEVLRSSDGCTSIMVTFLLGEERIQHSVFCPVEGKRTFVLHNLVKNVTTEDEREEMQAAGLDPTSFLEPDVQNKYLLGRRVMVHLTKSGEYLRERFSKYEHDDNVPF